MGQLAFAGRTIPAFLVALTLFAPCAMAGDDAALDTARPDIRMMAFEATEKPQLGTLPPDTGLAPGTPAPGAKLRDVNGMQSEISATWQDQQVLLVFYRGGWCPYCNYQIHELVQAFPGFEKRGVLPVAVSVDRFEETARIADDHGLPFPVFSDPDLVLHKAFRVVHQAGEEEFAMLSGYGIDLEASSGRSHHGFAVPALFLVDEGGTILWAHADPEYTRRPTAEQLLGVIDALAAAR